MARSTWTRKTYEMVAETLNYEYGMSITSDAKTGILNTAAEFARNFKADNPNFDRQRFMAAILGESR